MFNALTQCALAFWRAVCKYTQVMSHVLHGYGWVHVHTAVWCEGPFHGYHGYHVSCGLVTLSCLHVFADDILGITSSPTKRRPSTDYVCRPVVLAHTTRDLPHIHIHSNCPLQTVVEGEQDSPGGPNNPVQSEASEDVGTTNRFCNSILLPSDSQNWNINFDLRRSTLANLPQQTQPASPVEEDANSENHSTEERLQLSQAMENEEEMEEGECTVTDLSHLTPRTGKRVIILQHHEGTFVSVGKEMNKTATEESARGEGSPAS